MIIWTGLFSPHAGVAGQTLLQSIPGWVGGPGYTQVYFGGRCAIPWHAIPTLIYLSVFN